LKGQNKLKNTISSIANTAAGIGYLAAIGIASIPVVIGEKVNAQILKSFTGE